MLAAHNALQGKGWQLDHPRSDRDWLYSYVPIPEEGWAIVVQRPTDITFAALTNFQHGLIAALALLILGASFFWFMMHRRVISPLTRLAKAVSQIQPDQPDQVMHTGLLAKDRGGRTRSAIWLQLSLPWRQRYAPIFKRAMRQFRPSSIPWMLSCEAWMREFSWKVQMA